MACWRQLYSAQLCGAEAAVWLVSTLKRSKNGKCLQCEAAFFTSTYGTIRSVSSQALTRLICFHFSPRTWRMVLVGSRVRSRKFSGATRSALFTLPHGVHLPAVGLGNGESDTHVLHFAWKNVPFIPFSCPSTVRVTFFKCLVNIPKDV